MIRYSNMGRSLVLLIIIACVHHALGFSVSLQASARLPTPTNNHPTTIAISQSARWAASPLFSTRTSMQDGGSERVSFGFSRTIQSLRRKIQSPRFAFAFRRRLSRGLFLIFTAAFFWLGTASLHAKPTHASSAAVSPIERVLEKTSPSLDKIIDRYVKDHMFDADTYDPIESLYREAYDDASQGTYPQALREVVAESLGQKSDNSLAKSASKMTIEGMFFKAISTLQKRGLSQSTAMVVLASFFAIGGPLAFMFGFAIVSGISKRNMNKLMKSRYGEKYTLDATIKPEEVVEAPDDDEDEDDEDDDTDDA